jgi:hypothetical protein
MAMCVNRYMNYYIACCDGVCVIVKTFSSRAYSKLLRVFFVLAPKGYRNSAVFNSQFREESRTCAIIPNAGELD